MKTFRLFAFLFVSLLLFGTFHPVYAQTPGPIVLDGQFNDWVGQPCVSDPQNDQRGFSTSDIKTFCFTTNPGGATLYFMAERWGGGDQWVYYDLLLDTNQDGYAEWIVEVYYDPRRNNSRVDVVLYDGYGNWVQTIDTNVDWGESRREGGFKVEWGVPIDVLGITPGQTIDMQLWSRIWNTSYISDWSQIVTWSPANALGIGLLAILLLSGVLWFTYLKRKQKHT